jgi:hypothetical protein
VVKVQFVVEKSRWKFCCPLSIWGDWGKNEEASRKDADEPLFRDGASTIRQRSCSAVWLLSVVGRRREFQRRDFFTSSIAARLANELSPAG